MIDFARILRDAGLSVMTTPGWERRAVRGEFAPRGVLIHHTGARSSAANPAPSVQLCVEGRQDLQGPLYQRRRRRAGAGPGRTTE